MFFFIGVVYFVMALFWFELSHGIVVFKGLVGHARWGRALYYFFFEDIESNSIVKLISLFIFIENSILL